MQSHRPVSPRKSTLRDLVTIVMVLCRGHMENGAPFWAYVALRPEDAPTFSAARQRGALDLEDYGTIIEWGEGNNPPDDVKLRMLATYGMHDQSDEQLKAALILQGEGS